MPSVSFFQQIHPHGGVCWWSNILNLCKLSHKNTFVMDLKAMETQFNQMLALYCIVTLTTKQALISSTVFIAHVFHEWRIQINSVCGILKNTISYLQKVPKHTPTYKRMEDCSYDTGRDHTQHCFPSVLLAVYQHQPDTLKVTHGRSKELHKWVGQTVAGQNLHTILFYWSDSSVQSLPKIQMRYKHNLWDFLSFTFPSATKGDYSIR